MMRLRTDGEKISADCSNEESEEITIELDDSFDDTNM
jgi:hypothetical protein